MGAGETSNVIFVTFPLICMRTSLIPMERIRQKILLLRGHKVMLDQDLADLYGVDTKTLVRALKRNRQRFPKDFMFQLNVREFEHLRCQIGTSSSWGGRRYRPFAFTEQGVAMLSSVLQSKRAIIVNIAIMRAFVRLREVLATHKELALKLEELEKKFEDHDETIAQIFDAIKALMTPPVHENERRIGFRLDP